MNPNEKARIERDINLAMRRVEKALRCWNPDHADQPIERIEVGGTVEKATATLVCRALAQIRG